MNLPDATAGELSAELFRIGAVRFGDFRLKDGRHSPFYLDLRLLVAHPTALARVARAMLQRAAAIPYDRIAGIPYAGLPIAVAMALIGERPMIYVRKEAKMHGTQRTIEGEWHPAERALLVDDVITSGGAKLEALSPFRGAELRVDDVLVVIDRSGSSGAARLATAGVRLQSLLDAPTLFARLTDRGLVSDAEVARAMDFLGTAHSEPA